MNWISRHFHNISDMWILKTESIESKSTFSFNFHTTIVPNAPYILASEQGLYLDIFPHRQRHPTFRKNNNKMLHWWLVGKVQIINYTNVKQCCSSLESVAKRIKEVRNAKNLWWACFLTIQNIFTTVKISLYILLGYLRIWQITLNSLYDMLSIRLVILT